MALTKHTARDIVDALRNGTVPRAGLHEYAVGLEQHMQAMEEQLERVSADRGQVKFVRGEYGAGKTFLTHLLLETALKKGFVVSNIVISKDTPLHKLNEVYHEIVLNERIRLEDPNDPFPNYSQAQVVLRAFNREKLLIVGERVREIYEIAYGPLDRSRASDRLLQSLADRLTAKFGGHVEVVPRQFLRQLVDAFDRVRFYDEYNPLSDLDEDVSQQLTRATLTEVEEDYVTF